MVADVDLDHPDGRRVHVSEVARGLGGIAAVDLVVHGGDPGIAGVHHVAVPRWSGRWRIVALTAVAARILVRRRRPAGILYLRHDPGTVAIALLARLLRYRLVLEVNAVSVGIHRNPPEGVPARIKAAVKAVGDRCALRSAQAVVVVSAELREDVARLRRDGAATVHVIANGADTRTFHPMDAAAAAARLGLDAGDEHVVFTGTLTWWMDLDTLLAAFALVAGRRPAARLVIVGDGPERDRLEQRSVTSGGRVLFTGAIADRARVADYVAAATVCVAPTDPAMRTARSPLKTLEYLAVGRPVVATDLPGNRDPVVATGGGVLVPPSDAPTLAEAILSLLDDPQRAAGIGSAAATIVAAEHSWSAVVGRIEPLLQLRGARAQPAASARP